MKLTRDLREFIELLNARGVEYLLVGGWAFGFHATPRYTGDLDFFLKCDSENASRLKLALSDFGFTELPGLEEKFLQGDRMFQFGLPPNRIDILTKIDGISFAEAWDTRVIGSLEGLPVPIISRDCLIRNKLAAGRAKDLADVEALRNTAPNS
jgi:hypothetical protein